ncbi:MAG: NAD(P)-dependent alcohol dehydrogenase [Bacteroidales bacterium]|nr:NAD(P)-dependent alcohol dehydrogenase [Bacteroidales bacterium]
MGDTTMKAIWASGYGNHEVLQLKKVPIPQIKENEVLVKVKASVATTADTLMLSGRPWYNRLFMGLRKPKHAIPGTGFSGDVVAVGQQVKSFQIGDEVFGETTLGFGTNAEFVAVPENGVVLPKPNTLSHSEAATFCDGPLTSLNFLIQLGKVKPGQRVLINGASGSLGTAAVQLAKHFGAEVTGICSKTNMGWIKSLGADTVVDYQNEDYTKLSKPYDIMFDTVGKSSFSQVKHLLVKDGLYLSPVLKPSLIVQMLFTSLVDGKKAKFDATGLKPGAELKHMLSELVEIFNAGKLKIVLDRQFPLEKVGKAHAYISGGHKKGNVVILVDAENDGE